MDQSGRPSTRTRRGSTSTDLFSHCLSGADGGEVSLMQHELPPIPTHHPFTFPLPEGDLPFGSIDFSLFPSVCGDASTDVHTPCLGGEDALSFLGGDLSSMFIAAGAGQVIQAGEDLPGIVPPPPVQRIRQKPGPKPKGEGGLKTGPGPGRPKGSVNKGSSLKSKMSADGASKRLMEERRSLLSQQSLEATVQLLARRAEAAEEAARRAAVQQATLVWLRGGVSADGGGAPAYSEGEDSVLSHWHGMLKQLWDAAKKDQFRAVAYTDMQYPISLAPLFKPTAGSDDAAASAPPLPTIKAEVDIPKAEVSTVVSPMAEALAWLPDSEQGCRSGVGPTPMELSSGTAAVTPIVGLDLASTPGVGGMFSHAGVGSMFSHAGAGGMGGTGGFVSSAGACGMGGTGGVASHAGASGMGGMGGTGGMVSHAGAGGMGGTGGMVSHAGEGGMGGTSGKGSHAGAGGMGGMGGTGGTLSHAGAGGMGGTSGMGGTGCIGSYAGAGGMGGTGGMGDTGCMGGTGGMVSLSGAGGMGGTGGMFIHTSASGMGGMGGMVSHAGAGGMGGTGGMVSHSGAGGMGGTDGTLSYPGAGGMGGTGGMVSHAGAGGMGSTGGMYSHRGEDEGVGDMDSRGGADPGGIGDMVSVYRILSQTGGGSMASVFSHSGRGAGGMGGVFGHGGMGGMVNYGGISGMVSQSGAGGDSTGGMFSHLGVGAGANGMLSHADRGGGSIGGVHSHAGMGSIVSQAGTGAGSIGGHAGGGSMGGHAGGGSVSGHAGGGSMGSSGIWGVAAAASAAGAASAAHALGEPQALAANTRVGLSSGEVQTWRYDDPYLDGHGVRVTLECLRELSSLCLPLQAMVPSGIIDTVRCFCSHPHPCVSRLALQTIGRWQRRVLKAVQVLAGGAPAQSLSLPNMSSHPLVGNVTVHLGADQTPMVQDLQLDASMDASMDASVVPGVQANASFPSSPLAADEGQLGSRDLSLDMGLLPSRSPGFQPAATVVPDHHGCQHSEPAKNLVAMVAMPDVGAMAAERTAGALFDMSGARPGLLPSYYVEEDARGSLLDMRGVRGPEGYSQAQASPLVRTLLDVSRGLSVAGSNNTVSAVGFGSPATSCLDASNASSPHRASSNIFDTSGLVASRPSASTPQVVGGAGSMMDMGRGRPGSPMAVMNLRLS